MRAKDRRPWWVAVAVAVGLVALLWAGWSDFTLSIPREVVQENVRSSIRSVIRLVVQFVAPSLLIGFLVGEGLTALRSRR